MTLDGLDSQGRGKVVDEPENSSRQGDLSRPREMCLPVLQELGREAWCHVASSDQPGQEG